MAKIGHRRCPKGTLGALEAELVHPKHVEDDVEVLQVFGLGRAIYEDVIEKHQHEPTKKRDGARHSSRPRRSPTCWRG
jgi:hypothetical protein